MDKLEELEEELYGKGEEPLAKRRQRHFALPSISRDLRTSWSSGEKTKPLLQRLAVGKTALFLAATLFLFLGAGAVFVWFYMGIERTEATISIAGRDSLEGGELAVITVTVKNVSSTALQESELAITIPAGSSIQDKSGVELPSPPRIIERVGTLGPGEERTVELTARIFGKEGEAKEVVATLWYRPERLRARFSSEARKSFTISRVPLALFWEMPETVVPRQNIHFTLRFSSQARSRYEGLWARIDYPPGFTPGEADPKPDVGDTLWKIGTLEPGGEGKIALAGSFLGEGGKRQSLHAGIGIFDELTKEWRPWRESTKEVTLSVSPFLLETTLGGKREGVVRPGERLAFTVRYENRTAIAVKNVSVRAALEGEIIDINTLSIGNGGVFDFPTKTIVWGPGGTPGLQEAEPGEGGDLQFTVQTHSRPPVRTAEDRNLLVRARASIAAPQLPKEFEGSRLSPDDAIEFKVASVLLFAGRAAFYSSPIPNSGPLPPKVGERTSYTITYEIRNFTNELGNVEVRGFLPPNVKWENSVSPRGADIHFESASGEIRWRIGKIPPGTGVLTPALIGAFQVSVVPSEVDVGKALTLVRESKLRGRDIFTAEDLALKVGTLTTELREDPATKAEEWTVVR